MAEGLRTSSGRSLIWPSRSYFLTGAFAADFQTRAGNEVTGSARAGLARRGGAGGNRTALLPALFFGAALVEPGFEPCFFVDVLGTGLFLDAVGISLLSAVLAREP